VRVTEQQLILVVEDDAALRRLAAEVLTDAGWRVAVLTGPPSIDAVRAERPAAVVLDWRLNNGTVDPFLETLRADETLHSVPVVLWTGADIRAVADQLRIRYAPIAIVIKPAVLPELPEAISALLGE
jgi:CheY-like chemotaxis protein